MQRTLIKDAPQNIGKEVKLNGWAHTIRAHGNIIFCDLRDKTGIVQVVFGKEVDAKKIRPEWVLEIIGTVNERPEGMQNEKIETGKIEIYAKELKILNQSETTPFEISEDTKKISEEKRMKYRYLDLRTERMKNNLILRHKVIK